MIVEDVSELDDVRATINILYTHLQLFAVDQYERGTLPAGPEKSRHQRVYVGRRVQLFLRPADRISGSDKYFHRFCLTVQASMLLCS